ncbi:MAG: 5-deoxy-glucuronate isomerase [Nostocoides sp.]
MKYHLPAGSTAADGYDTVIDPGTDGWSHTGLRILTLAPGASRRVETGGCEWIVLPLGGGGATLRVEGEDAAYDLDGRPDVWSGPSDLLYVPRDSAFTVTSPSGGTLALAYAPARRAFPVCRVAASDVPVELRGAGACSRQVHNFGTPGTLDADSIIACEVYTPAGNWSSYPPHKHDEDRPGDESELEEIYYFRLRVAPDSQAPPDADPIGYQRVYGTDERPIDVLAEVRTDDVVLVPHGWHGPAMAAAGYDMYYLNVMGGPGEQRAWLICDDPAHGWVRRTWESQPVDPRLPLNAPRG